MSAKIIKINRGDSSQFTISIPNKDNSSEKYFLEKNFDIVYFAVMYPHQPFENAYLFKGYTFEDQDQTTGEILIEIEPNDTRQLTPGVYYYTIKLQRGGTLGIIDDLDEPVEVRTLIERTKFIVTE